MTDLKVEGTKLIGAAKYDEEDPLALKCKRQAKCGILKGCSPGIIINSLEERIAPDGSSQLTVTDWELCEVSLVSVPSNRNALKLYNQAGEPIPDEQVKLSISDLLNKHKKQDMSVQQITRELPSMTMGANMFFLAISNNLPILADNIKAVREENAALIASGQKATPVWKQVAGSFLSWQTAMVVGITLLSAYGTQIIDAVSGLVKGKSATDDIKRSQESLNEALKKGTEDAQKDVIHLRLLYNATQDHTKALDERKEAVKGLKKEYPSYFKNMSDEFIMAGKAKDAYDKLATSIVKVAQARAIEDKLVENEKKALDNESKMAAMNLRNGDYVRIQRSEGLNIRYLIGKVSNVTTSSFDLAVTDGEDIPVIGDVAFRVGNESDKSRQGLIYLTSSDDYASYIDVLDGITDGSFSGKTKVRLGNLQGITVSGNPLDGYGLYVKGGIYEDCTYLLEDGTTIEQKFSTLNGKLDSEISSLRNDMSMETGNILRNSSFTSNTKYWNNSSTAHFIVVSGAYLYFSGYNYIEKNSIADIYTDNGRNVLRILNSSITQTNDCLIIPAHEWKFYNDGVRNTIRD